MDDRKLLDEYAASGSPEAMSALVQRHAPMIYSAALRDLRDPHLAEDVTQAVFIVLMRRARHLSAKVVLAGWLFKVTRYAAADARKREARRQRREHEVASMKEIAIQPGDDESAYQQIMPLLNDAVARLPQRYRDAVVLKYLQGKSHLEVAQAMQITENTARQRLLRGMKKLRSFLGNRGINMGENLLGLALARASLDEAPANIVNHILAFVRAEPAASGGNSAMIAKGVNQMIIWAKIKFIGAACLTIIVATGAIAVVAQVNRGDTVAAPSTRPIETTARDFVAEAFQTAQTGNEENFLRYFSDLTADQELRLRSAARALAAAETLRIAILEKFGEEAANRLTRQISLGVQAKDLAAAKVAVTGDSALVDLGNVGPGKVTLIKVGQSWKIDVTKMSLPPAEQLTRMDQQMQGLRRLAGEVVIGRFTTPEELQAAMAQMTPRRSGPATGASPR